MLRPRQLGQGGPRARHDRGGARRAGSMSIAIPTRIPPAATRSRTCCRNGCRPAACAAMIDRLASPETRTRIRDDIARDGLNNWGRLPSWDACRFRSRRTCRNSPAAPSRALAAERGQDPIDTLCDYLADDQGATRVLVTSISEDDVRDIVRSPLAAGRLRRQLRRDLRHRQPGHAAPALLRHVPARHRPLCRRARPAAARARHPQDDRRDRARAQARRIAAC